jgi:phosphomannomutase
VGAGSGVSPVRFGTDGWRGVIAREFTFDNVARVARALAGYLQSETRKDNLIYQDWGSPFRVAASGIVIGYDTRFLSKEFAHHFAGIVQDDGVPAVVSDAPVPTPAVSYAVVNRCSAAGIMVTCSHNPPMYNGIKVKEEYGGSAPREVTQEIEARLPARVPARRRRDALIAEADLRTPFLEKIRTLIDPDRLTASPIQVVVDSMYGSAQGYVAQILDEFAIPYVQIRGTRDVLFGGKKPEPLEENLIPLRAVIASMKGRRRRLIGVVTDGDGDRISAMDERGGFIDAHRTYALILRYLVEDRGWRGDVVVSFNLSDLVRRMCAEYGLSVIEIPIGFKYAAEQILKRDVLIAGEESGSLAIRGHIPDRDGVLLSLLLVEMLATGSQPVSRMVGELHRRFGPQVFRRRDLVVDARLEIVERLTARPPDRFGGKAVRSVETLDGVKLRFDDGWLLFRASGTEPILRVYCEMKTEAAVDTMLGAAEKLTEEA